MRKEFYTGIFLMYIVILERIKRGENFYFPCVCTIGKRSVRIWRVQ